MKGTLITVPRVNKYNIYIIITFPPKYSKYSEELKLKNKKKLSPTTHKRKKLDYQNNAENCVIYDFAFLNNESHDTINS